MGISPRQILPEIWGGVIDISLALIPKRPGQGATAGKLGSLACECQADMNDLSFLVLTQICN
jgi:hypothetical protein